MSNLWVENVASVIVCCVFSGLIITSMAQTGHTSGAIELVFCVFHYLELCCSI